MRTKAIQHSLYILISVSVFSSSCGKFLQVEPKDSVSDEQTIVDGSSAETAVRGVYNSLGSNGYYGFNFLSIGYFSGDNVVYLGPQIQNRQFTDHDVRADNSVLESVWLAAYSTINRANHVIAKVPGLVAEGSFSEQKKSQLIGEAYFVRALAYFDLARTFGGAQIVLQPTQGVESTRGITRSTVAETYAQVLSDLEEAEKLLPETTNRIRATRKTVWALKARYYLYHKQWEQAETYASKLIADNSYQLVTPYKTFFTNNASATQESVFEIAYNSSRTNSLSGEWRPTLNGGTGRIGPSNDFVTLANNPDIGGGRKDLLTKIDIVTGGNVQTTWWGQLYYRNPATDPVFVFRIAELYLIRAEARAEQGGAKLTGAQEDLNKIRQRAGIPLSTANTREDLLLAIENERRLEFAFEPHRWFDLVRTGRVGAVLHVTDPNKFILPIPINQILIDRENLNQNPGY